MSKLKRRFYKHLWLLRPLIYFLIITFFLLCLVWFTPKLWSILKTVSRGPSMLISLINPGLEKLNKYRDRTNILLLGIGGGSHPGADLTDSLMLISVNLLNGDTVIISLPRDIWVESLSAKLNTAYHFGETKESGGGLVLAKAAVSEITHQPIHYAVLLDFSGFEKAIDVLGGIDLNIPHGFVDEKYPLPGQENAAVESARYEIIKFSAGLQHLDGPTALKYVRSRQAQGEEGTDYARAQRQQLVILAFKDQLLSLKTLFHPRKLKNLKAIFKDSVKTDIPVSGYPDMLKLVLRLNKDKIRTGILDQGSESEDIPPLLYNPSSSLYGQWVLLPINNDWQAIYDHVAEIIYQNQSATTQ